MADGVDFNNSDPTNKQATGGTAPAWQANSVLVGTVWVRKDDKTVTVPLHSEPINPGTP